MSATQQDLETIHLLKTATQLDVHRWSDYPEVNRAVEAIFEEIVRLRRSKGKRIRLADKVYRHLKVVVIDLFAAHQEGINPWRGISKRKPDYQCGSRYRKIHLKYDYLIGVLNDLIELGYIKQHKGNQAMGKRTRVKATTKLIEKIFAPQFNVCSVLERDGVTRVFHRSQDDETIILRNADDELQGYTDTQVTILMRESLARINAKLLSAHITLDITDDQHRELAERFRQADSIPINFGHRTLHRVFNDPSFRLGGRFYGGWWQNLPSKYRKFIRINHKPTVEIDYSGHHIRMLYARKGLSAAEDLYAIENCSFSRDVLKLAALIVVNSKNRASALKALNAKKLGVDSRALLSLIEEHFAPISEYFYSNAGMELQYEDSIVAERVMLRMLELGAVVLPIHDSFIVRNSYEEELWNVMLSEYERQFGNSTFLKKDVTVLDAESRHDLSSGELVTDDLEALLSFENRTWSREMFGIE